MTDANDGYLQGNVDSWIDGRLKGWVWRPNRADAIVVVEARVDGRVVASGPAYLPRADVAHVRGGACGFDLIVDLPGNAPVEIDVRASDNQEQLPGSPLRLAAGERRRMAPLEPWPRPGLVGVLGSLDDFGPEGIKGWVCSPQIGAPSLVLELFDGETPVANVTADGWRNDLEDFRDGDGACAFSITLPEVLTSGAVHRVDLRLAGGGASLLSAPVEVAVSRASAFGRSLPAPRWRGVRRARCKLSFVVVFYNMRREAERTLRSLTREYQIGIDELEYEVLCIDNGSAQPLDPEWVASFGPEFRLVDVSKTLPSPCFAMNEAASAARGDRIALMIDGAHVLSPGAIREAMQAMDERPGAIVALRQWFVNGDQRWLSSVNYSRSLEDKLFRKIAWPSDGYRLFEISTPMFESPNHWFDGLNESNCLFLDTELYRRIGGIDEAFSEPGAGFANLDLFERAAHASNQRVVSLVGEASFHQFHGGTTTNVDDETKDALVEDYKQNYRALRGKEFKGIGHTQLYFRGTIHTDQALTARQQMLFPGGVGVTDRLRPVKQEDWFEEEAQAFTRTIYAESGEHTRVRWLGEPVDLAPADLLNIQEIMRVDRPSGIVVVDGRNGLAGFLASTARELGLACRIVHVRAHHEGTAIQGVMRVEGRSDDASALSGVRAALGDAKSVMALFEPDAGDWYPVEALSTWSELVTPGAMFVILRTAIGLPWMGYLHNRRYGAARALVAQGRFEFEASWQRQMIVMCPFGYLRRCADK